MIVIDASAMVEALVGRDADEGLLQALSGDLDAPHLLDVEVLSVLRGLLLGGKLVREVAEQARRDHFAFTITRHETAPLAERVWQLRHQFTSYDASYLALAEALQAPLWTCDAKLATNGHNAEVHLIQTSCTSHGEPRSRTCESSRGEPFLTVPEGHVWCTPPQRT